MKRDVKDIRRSIAERKKKRGVGGERKSTSTSTTQAVSYVQEEEKYGYFPFSENDRGSNANAQFLTAFLFKSVIAGVLFFSVAILYRLDAAFLETPQQWVDQAVTEEFQFAAVNQWYMDKFGEPLAFLPQSPGEDEVVPTAAGELALPVSGSIRESFQTNGQGVVIETSSQEDILASGSGMVEFAGKKEDTGNTVIIQHADGSKSHYGYLSEINVNQYQQVSAGNVIGKTAPAENGTAEKVYFAIQKGGQFVDPIEVIQVHDEADQ
ncbi:M23 family metallopeptidase [Pontibacillus salipaludis]|uniref:M23ase beta-sheet core domain-containing protein n=1 Tax=Pontibacillus salipaludis TaxID=1697394 RepID=A0ABQ1PTS8_9BACI|nr:M23 family metallopeptidase [Pontibacillus salipaludis]GGD03590.1 hypothetical protein GCM10011389_08920 [Pontibacillus salipaludis]